MNVDEKKTIRKSRGEYFPAGLLLLFVLLILKPFSGVTDYCRVPLLDPAGVLQVYPWVKYNAIDLSLGHFPLWNPMTAMGQPHLANIQTALFFPLYWGWTALGAGDGAYGITLIFRLWAASMLWFRFARRHLCSFWGALVCGAAYGAGGYSLWFMQLLDLNSQMLLPLLMAALAALVSRPGISVLLASALLVALAVLGGHPEAAFITVFVALLYTMVSYLQERERRPLPGLVMALSGAGLLGLFLTAAVTIPFMNYLTRSWTMHGPGFGFFHLDPRGLFNLMVPGVHALFSGMPREIPVEHISRGPLEMLLLPYSQTSVPGNLPGAGIAVCGLALIGMIRAARSGWRALFFTGLLALLLGLTLGLPGFRLMALVPPFNMNSNFKFFFSEIHACLAILAGVGLDSIRRGAEGKRRAWAALVLALALAAVAVFILYPDFSWRPGEKRLPLLLAPASMLHLACLAAMVFLFRHPRAPGRVAGAAAFALVAASLALNAVPIRPFVEIERPAAEVESRILAALEPTSRQGSRMTGIMRYWPANLAMTQGIKDVRSSDALFYRPYVELINRVNGLGPEESLDYFYPSYYTRPQPERLAGPEARALSVGAAVGSVRWTPSGIMDHAVQKGRGVYGEAPPAVMEFELGEDGGESWPGLFAHAPSRVDIPPASLFGCGGRENIGGSISFIPAIKSRSGDGVTFQAVVIDSGKSALGYSRFYDPSRPLSGSDASVIFEAGDGILELSTLPGPNNDRTRDWSGFAALSFHPCGYEPPPAPAWSSGPWGPFVYSVDHLPWAHLEGDDEPLEFEREAGDAVSIELSGAGGKTLVVHEAWYPGWEVLIDGSRGRIDVPEDLVSWRVAIPPGAGRATFVFVPDDFRIGLFFTLGSALVSFLVIIPWKARNKN